MHRLVLLTLLLMLLCLNTVKSNAACQIRIISLSLCNTQGDEVTASELHPHYTLRLIWEVQGQPSAGYHVILTIANQRAVYNFSARPGNFSAVLSAYLPIVGKIPYSAQIDPGHVTDNTLDSQSARSGVFVPKMPSTAVLYYNPKSYVGKETLNCSYTSQPNSKSQALMVMAEPSTGTFQTVTTSVAPTDAQKITSAGSNQTGWLISCSPTNPKATLQSWHTDQLFHVECSSAAVNSKLANLVSWSDFSNLPENKRVWLKPEFNIESDSPVVRAFVQHILPADFKTTMTPYQAARTIFLAIVKKTVYVRDGQDPDTVDTLKTHTANCEGFSTVFVACMRSLGIPARALCGVLADTGERHCIAEFYLPGAGWIPADSAYAKGYDPTGTYAFFFGDDPDLNHFCVISRCTGFQIPNHSSEIMPAGSFFTQNVLSSTCQETCVLTPQ